MSSKVTAHFTAKCETTQIRSTLNIWKISTTTTAKLISFKMHEASLFSFIDISHE